MSELITGCQYAYLLLSHDFPFPTPWSHQKIERAEEVKK